MRCLTTSGCSSRNSVVTMRWVVTNWPSGQRSRLVDEGVPAALLDQARGPRLGHPGAVDRPGLERRQGVGVVLRCDVHVTATRSVGDVPLLLQPRPQRDVLGVAERRRRQGRAGEVLRGVDAITHDERGATRCRSGDDPQCLAARLGVAVDRRVGPDEAGVQRTGEHRLDDLGARVERRRLQRHRRPESVGEVPTVHPDDRRRVGDVREVAEPQRRRAARRGRGAGDRAGGGRGRGLGGSGGGRRGGRGRCRRRRCCRRPTSSRSPPGTLRWRPAGRAFR